MSGLRLGARFPVAISGRLRNREGREQGLFLQCVLFGIVDPTAAPPCKRGQRATLFTSGDSAIKGVSVDDSDLDGVNMVEGANERPWFDGGLWRMEIQPETGRKEDHFLVVMKPRHREGFGPGFCQTSSGKRNWRHSRP